VTETTLQAAIAAEATALERELAEIDMLIAQARTEATRHEQHRTQAQTKLSAASSEAPAEWRTSRPRSPRWRGALRS